MNHHSTVSASFTIEASIIFSILLSIVFLLIRLIFTLYDVSLSKSLSYRYLICYSIESQETYAIHNTSVPDLENSFRQINILNELPTFTFRLKENNLEVDSNYYKVPVTFSNYNHTDHVWSYFALKNRKKGNIENEY